MWKGDIMYAFSLTGVFKMWFAYWQPKQSTASDCPAWKSPETGALQTKAWSTHASVPRFFLFYTTQVIQDYLQVGKMTPQKQLCCSVFLRFPFLTYIFPCFKDFAKAKLAFLRASCFWYVFYNSSWSWVSRGCQYLEAARENKKLPKTLREEIPDASSSPAKMVVWAVKAEPSSLLF